ncbi:hypothetical protein EJ08DRAFT_411570 [Tothia fuscella]|uniref:Uncharacterized protein n=1 Tax=Tothia fuscella TaxID=1048955 RepID=A0A9P4TUE8_9PEZI|nr:hypothetical protein EJ08DRAFT_411570 [Tothia fuscella]
MDSLHNGNVKQNGINIFEAVPNTVNLDHLANSSLTNASRALLLKQRNTRTVSASIPKLIKLYDENDKESKANTKANKKSCKALKALRREAELLGLEEKADKTIRDRADSKEVEHPAKAKGKTGDWADEVEEELVSQEKKSRRKPKAKMVGLRPSQAPRRSGERHWAWGLEAGI